MVGSIRWVGLLPAPDDLKRLVGVASHVPSIVDYMADDPLLVDNERDPLVHAAFIVIDAERSGHLVEGNAGGHGESDAAVVRKGLLGKVEVRAGG